MAGSQQTEELDIREEIYRCWSPNKLMTGKVWLIYTRGLTPLKRCSKKLLLP